jgi:hypothetical protein
MPWSTGASERAGLGRRFTQSAADSAAASHAGPIQGKPSAMRIEQATQSERAETNGKTLSPRLDTEPFMEASLPADSEMLW